MDRIDGYFEVLRRELYFNRADKPIIKLGFSRIRYLNRHPHPEIVIPMIVHRCHPCSHTSFRLHTRHSGYTHVIPVTHTSFRRMPESHSGSAVGLRC
jgi:hypothetical protein